MFVKLKTLVLSLSILMTVLVPIAAPAAVLAAANIQGSLCGAATTLSVDASPDTNCQTATQGSESHFQTILADAINIFSLIVGIVAVIMIIFGGFKYITSAGNQEKVKSAKQTLVYALIGIIIVALAQIIVKFVLNQTSSGVCTKTLHGYHWVGGPDNGKPCTP